MKKSEIQNLVVEMAKSAHEASLKLATLPTCKKNAVLASLARLIEENTGFLMDENARDLQAGKKAGLKKALLDRLTLTPERISAMADGVRQVEALPDPVGEEIEKTTRPNSLDIRKVRVPIGVIGIIFESRPNVTIDCAVLCLKSGNASILRGGKEAFYSNKALAGLIDRALKSNDVTPDAVQLIPTTDRKALNVLLKQDSHIHCIIPRGGEGLIRFVTENSNVPVIKHYEGVCCLYIDEKADPDRAEAITINAKVQRPGVCNAAENLFIHRKAAPQLLPRIAQSLHREGVELRVDAESAAILDRTGTIPHKSATEEDYFKEFLDLVISVKIVDSVSEAISAVNKYGSGHSDAIITENETTAETFMAGVDSATVYWNASTRFTDGFEFGFGAEIGISTDKLHARGPMGLRELTTYKYKIYGTGQIR